MFLRPAKHTDTVAKIKAESAIAGVDEAGRGALAGPVVAGACVLFGPLFHHRVPFPCWSPFCRKGHRDDLLIADSKMLTPEQRERSFAWIAANCAYGHGIASHAMIDRDGILPATERAMRMALTMLTTYIVPTELLVDGRDHFRFPLPHTSIVRGDSLEPCIAAASIVAKVTRDRLMREQDPIHPKYGFAQHKGYGTPEHIRMIRVHGPCSLHRKSFLSRVTDDARI